MDTKEKIKSTLKSIMGEKKFNLPFSGKVISIEGITCTIEISKGFNFSDVRLKSSEKESENFELRTPVVGSNVTVVSLTGQLDNLVAIQFDELAKLEYVKNGLRFLLDSDAKVSIKNNAMSLKDLFAEVKTVLESFSVIYINAGGAPTPTTPNELMTPILTAFETKVNSLLK